MARKISISFKETKKDMELYNLIMNMEDKSCEIKCLLRKALKLELSLIEKTDLEEVNKDINILDF